MNEPRLEESPEPAYAGGPGGVDVEIQERAGCQRDYRTFEHEAQPFRTLYHDTITTHVRVANANYAWADARFVPSRVSMRSGLGGESKTGTPVTVSCKYIAGVYAHSGRPECADASTASPSSAPSFAAWTVTSQRRRRVAGHLLDDTASDFTLGSTRSYGGYEVNKEEIIEFARR